MAYVRLLWAREGRKALRDVHKMLAGVSVEAVSRLTKAADSPTLAQDITKLEGLLGIGLTKPEWAPGDDKYNQVMNAIVELEMGKCVYIPGCVCGCGCA
jgi:hypothetical protein